MAVYAYSCAENKSEGLLMLLDVFELYLKLQDRVLMVFILFLLCRPFSFNTDGILLYNRETNLT